MKTMSILQALLVALALGTLAAAPAQAAIELADIACESTATTGTGTLDLDGAATGGYLSLAAAGVSSGATVPYQITTGTGPSRKIETGWGVWTDGDPDTLSRDAIITTDDQSDPVSELSLSGTSTVCVGPIAELYRGPYRVGEHFWYGADTCPNYALPEDGAMVSQTAYAALHDVVGDDAFGTDGDGDFAMPNLTSGKRFIRAADGSTILVGNTQSDAFQGHKHQNSRILIGRSAGASALYSAAGPLAYNSTLPVTGGYGAPRIATETRPINFAFTPCMVF